MTSNAEKVAAFRHQSHGGMRDRRWVKSVTITNGGVWINGVEFPWFIQDDGVNVEWDEPDGKSPQSFRIGRLSLDLMMTDDDTIITDLRKQTLANEIEAGERKFPEGMPR